MQVSQTRVSARILAYNQNNSAHDSNKQYFCAPADPLDIVEGAKDTTIRRVHHIW